ncbi:MAG: hypothetical protein IJX64_01800 [Clostridia bacterium]|nr:hypothetical protein [Clostridia bacterium]
MIFEAEVIPLFIGGVSIVSILELVFGCMMLKHRKKARICWIGHAASMAAAWVFLIRCIFANYLNTELGIASISNSVNIGLFGVFWAISVFFLLATVKVGAEKDEA